MQYALLFYTTETFDALPPAEVTVGREKARSVQGGLDGPAQQGLHAGVTSGGGVYSVSA